jgi:hypothetical protein
MDEKLKDGFLTQALRIHPDPEEPRPLSDYHLDRRLGEYPHGSLARTAELLSLRGRERKAPEAEASVRPGEPPEDACCSLSLLARADDLPRLFLRYRKCVRTETAI